MFVKARLIGIEPKQVPCNSHDGWYEFSLDQGSTVEDVLSRFGLKAGSLSVMRNESLADIEDIVEDQDELQILLKSLGG